MTGPSIFWVIGALSGVIALIAAAARFLQSGGWRPQPRAGRILVVRESISLDPRRRVHLIQFGQKQVVLLTGGGQDVVIGWMPHP